MTFVSVFLNFLAIINFKGKVKINVPPSEKLHEIGFQETFNAYRVSLLEPKGLMKDFLRYLAPKTTNKR